MSIFSGLMAFFAAEFFPFDINELAGFVVPAVMTNAAAFLRQTIRMDCMREFYHWPS